ncbi:hypothetical protein C1Y63_05910 [Corynebacterium sp. 13CS0277]|uniref:hypothetical protein n=1 Tax=Corynebacterium sp. 13CS0277 TaxID=2071994 RepID=UPI000D040606|nr:hypothetical protein [Corynebacterium sp. 13CS0277]PRQ11535.1 hypothetical protein C1Y63_05910 [Corynebacterium sp. 13CS0277]
MHLTTFAQRGHSADADALAAFLRSSGHQEAAGTAEILVLADVNEPGVDVGAQIVLCTDRRARLAALPPGDVQIIVHRFPWDSDTAGERPWESGPWVVTLGSDIARVVAELLLPTVAHEVPDARRGDFLAALATYTHLQDQLAAAAAQLDATTRPFRSIDQ